MALRAPQQLAELPLSLTVLETASVLRVSRTTVYEMANRWELSDGRDGLACYRVGRCLRIRRSAVVALLTAGADDEPAA